LTSCATTVPSKISRYVKTQEVRPSQCYVLFLHSSSNSRRLLRLTLCLFLLRTAHLVGNVYVKYEFEEDAEKAMKALTGRFYGGRLLVPEYSPVTDFREGRCRQYDLNECQRGGQCNFLHLKRLSNDLERRLFGRRRRRSRYEQRHGREGDDDNHRHHKRSRSSRSRSRDGDRDRDPDRGPDRDRDRHHDRRSRHSRSRSPRRRRRERERSREPASEARDRDARSASPPTRLEE